MPHSGKGIEENRQDDGNADSAYLAPRFRTQHTVLRLGEGVIDMWIHQQVFREPWPLAQ